MNSEKMTIESFKSKITKARKHDESGVSIAKQLLEKI